LYKVIASPSSILKEAGQKRKSFGSDEKIGKVWTSCIQDVSYSSSSLSSPRRLPYLLNNARSSLRSTRRTLASNGFSLDCITPLLANRDILLRLILRRSQAS